MNYVVMLLAAIAIICTLLNLVGVNIEHLTDIAFFCAILAFGISHTK